MEDQVRPPLMQCFEDNQRMLTRQDCFDGARLTGNDLTETLLEGDRRNGVLADSSPNHNHSGTRISLVRGNVHVSEPNALKQTEGRICPTSAADPVTCRRWTLTSTIEV